GSLRLSSWKPQKSHRILEVYSHATYAARHSRALGPAAGGPAGASALAQNAGETKIIDRIAAVYGSSASDLQAMRAAGLGWGEIIMILELSSRSGTPVSDIQAMHAEGKGFGQIAKELGGDPADLGQAVADVMSGGRSGGP